MKMRKKPVGHFCQWFCGFGVLERLLKSMVFLLVLWASMAQIPTEENER
jgi:hypothetical protein